MLWKVWLTGNRLNRTFFQSEKERRAAMSRPFFFGRGGAPFRRNGTEITGCTENAKAGAGAGDTKLIFLGKLEVDFLEYTSLLPASSLENAAGVFNHVWVATKITGGFGRL